jgi:hypothetical protein
MQFPVEQPEPTAQRAVEVRVESSVEFGLEQELRAPVSRAVQEAVALAAALRVTAGQMVAREEMRPEVQQPEGLETPEEILEVRTDFREVWEREEFSS